MTLFSDVTSERAFHIGGGANFAVVQFKGRFVTVGRTDKTGHAQPAFLPADVDPLLPGREKRAVKSDGNTAIINQFGGKFRRRAAGGLRKNFAGDFTRQLLVHDP